MTNPDAGLPLEPDRAERAALAAAVVGFADEFIERLASGPASSPPADPALVAELLSPPPEHGVGIEALLARLDRALDTGFDTASGRFLSYIPSGGLYSAAIGRLLSAVANRYTGGAHAAPGAVAIEEGVIAWMTSVFGMPSSAGGVLLSGGSLANLTAVVTARARLGDDFGAGVIYTSARAHHSIHKAARIAGIGADRVREVPTDAALRIDPSALERSMAEDRRAGLRPMMIAATAGTTDTGAIDPLGPCADLAASEDAWFHVDAAYGGFFRLTERGRHRLAGIERSDSITVDAHKSLFLPFGIGGLLVADRAPLVDAHSGQGAYMRDVVETDLPHYFSMGPELTRPSRGLPVWLALHLHGVEAFRATLDRMLDMAARVAERLAAMPGLAVAADPELSIVAFRSEAGDAETNAILAALNASREVHVSSTTIDGRVYVRLAFLSQRTTDEIADRAVELVDAAARAS